ETARFILRLPAPTPAQLAWAIDQAGPVFPPEEEEETLRRLMEDAAARPPVVRDALARLAARWGQSGEGTRPPETERSPERPHARAAALTPERAAELMADPTRETSWHVLAKAARLAKVPLWTIEPEQPWRPPEQPPPVVEPLLPTRAAAPHTCVLG